MTKILIATKNDGKAREYRRLLNQRGLRLLL